MNKFRKATHTLLLFLSIAVWSHAQEKDSLLFDADRPLDIKLKVSIRSIQDSSDDTLYVAKQLYYNTGNHGYDSVKTELKGRGHFRLRECYFPPLTVKFKAGDVKKTVFENNKKLKLVMPCKNQQESNDLVVKEFLCYKLYEVVTPYCFKTRLVNIDFTEEQKKKEKNFRLKGILIEDDDRMAKRFGGKIVENVRASAVALQDTADLRMSFFQYMISNTDWSSVYLHNIKLLQVGETKFIPVSYDFDMCGIVDAPYSIVSETAGGSIGSQQSVKDRLYRGWCREDGITQFVRNEFIAKETLVMQVVDAIGKELPEKQRENLKIYLGEFFKTLKDDGFFSSFISKQCRKS